jgi:hypothetical protein
MYLCMNYYISYLINPGLFSVIILTVPEYICFVVRIFPSTDFTFLNLYL